MPAASWTVIHRPIPEHVVPGKRLGRHVLIDSRSAAYPYQRQVPSDSLANVLHARHIPILDQGDVGSCTGNAEVGALGTDPLFGDLPAGYPALDETEALRLYSAAEVIDGSGPYPPNDDGSSGTSVCKAAVKAGLISGYTHASSVADMADALQSQPVIVGVNWYDSFDQPSSLGLVSISPGAQIRGGHEFLVRGVDPAARTFSADNSWGTAWGNMGTFYFTWDTMDRLFSEQGDCTVSVPLSQPAPAPVPADPDTALWATAGPWCAQARTRPDLVVLKGALETWAHVKGLL